MKVIQQTTNNLVLKDSAGLFLDARFIFRCHSWNVCHWLMGAFTNLYELNEWKGLCAWIVSLSGLAGIWFIYTKPGTRLDFDKRGNMLTIQRRVC